LPWFNCASEQSSNATASRTPASGATINLTILGMWPLLTMAAFPC